MALMRPVTSPPGCAHEKVDSVEALAAQIREDVNRARDLTADLRRIAHENLVAVGPAGGSRFTVALGRYYLSGTHPWDAHRAGRRREPAPECVCWRWARACNRP